MSRLVLGPVLQRPLCEVIYVKAGTGPVLQRPLCEVIYVKAGTGASLTKSTL